MAAVTDTLKLFLTGDVMTARGIDAVLPHPGDPRLYEDYVKKADDYVRLAERRNSPIPARSISTISGALRWMSSNVASHTHASSTWKQRCPDADDRSQRASITA